MDLDAEKPMILHLIPRPSGAHTVPEADIQEEKEEKNAAHTQKGGQTWRCSRLIYSMFVLPGNAVLAIASMVLQEMTYFIL